MIQVSVYMMGKQIDQIKKYAVLHKMSFNEVIRTAVNAFFKSEREREIEKWQQKSNSKTN